MDYSKQQLTAIAHREGPCLVLAVPGAGKTTVLLQRAAALVQAGIPQTAILTVTFSRMQATDMKYRFETEFPALRQMTFSTIHAFCYRILTQIARRKRVPPPGILESTLSTGKTALLLRLADEQLGVTLTEEDADNFFRIDGFLRNALIEYSAYRKQGNLGMPRFEELAQIYASYKRMHGVIDFDDMLVQTLALLTEEEDVLQTIRAQYRYFQVDEAQDTSYVQLRILRLCSGPEENLFLVADDDQAIYGFRGADPRLLLRFPEVFPKGKILYLEGNYRSTSNIVQLSNTLIRHNVDRFPKVPITENEEKRKVEILTARDVDQQYRYLLRQLRALPKGETCAILYRNNLSVIALADSLQRAGIPFFCSRQALSFFRSDVVRDALHALQLAEDPTDTEAFAAIYYKLNAYLKKVFLHQIEAADPRRSVFERLRDCDGTQNRFYREKIDRLERTFRHMAHLPAEKALSLFENLGYAEYRRERARRLNLNHLLDARNLESMSLLSRNLYGPAAVSTHLSSLQERLRRASETLASITLSTVHGAKGLEFDRVYLIDLMQDEFPNVTAQVREKQGDGRFMEEERRLFYVGMTRAKKALALLGVRSIHGEPCEVSQFLQELMVSRPAEKRAPLR